MTIPTPMRFRPPTGETLDPVRAAGYLHRVLPPTSLGTTAIVILDLRGMGLIPGVLRELVVPLGQRIRGGMYGDAKLVILASDSAVREVVDLYARDFDFPVYVAASPEEIPNARPGGELTTTEFDTLDRLHAFGGAATVAGLAGFVSIEPTAANNRLVNLERKGFVFRIERPRPMGDLFVDPRTSIDELFGNLEVARPPRDALRAAGIETDPYDTSPLTLDGDAAERAAEILRRRGRAR